MRRLRIAVTVTFAVCLIFHSRAAWAADVLVFAASSTADALAEVNRDYVAAVRVRVAVALAVIVQIPIFVYFWESETLLKIPIVF